MLSEKIIALSSFKGLGTVTVSKFLEEKFQRDQEVDFDFSDFDKSSLNSIKRLIDQKILTPFTWKSKIDWAKVLISNSLKLGIYTINFTDECYPKELYILKKRPPILFAKGNIDLLKENLKVAVIGTREPSLFAEKMTTRITAKFVESGFTIVSGLALGCDTLAHRAAVELNGKTIAILAHGLDQRIYPSQNGSLAEEILDSGGCLISEYSIGTKMIPSYLVQRDEWQSGISSGTVAIESSLTGGTRHASYKSLDQGRVLGVLDHRCFHPKGVMNFFNESDEQIGLNMKLIKDASAIPLYSEQSITDYMYVLQKKADEITKEFREKTFKKFLVTTDKKQLDLFVD